MRLGGESGIVKKNRHSGLDPESIALSCNTEFSMDPGSGAGVTKKLDSPTKSASDEAERKLQ
jgi:hypothetical protein